MKAPMSSRERAARRARTLGFDRLSLFVPAVMSVGVLFWIISEVIEVVRSRAEQSRDRRSQVAASAVVDELVGRAPTQAAGLRPRPVYLVVAVALVAIAAYVDIGSIANFAREDSYVEGIAWLLALAVAASAMALLFAATAFTVFVSWPHPPAWARGILLRSPLGSPSADGATDGRPSWRLGVVLGVSAMATALVVALVAWSQEIVDDFNTEVASWFADHDPLGSLSWLDAAGHRGVAVALALVACVLALRCRVVVACYVTSLVAGLLLSAVLRPLVAQARKPGDPFANQLESFPSGSLVLIVVVAGLFPVALAVFFGRTGIIRPLRVVGAVLVAASATHDIASGELPTDVLGGVLLGLSLVVVSQWVIDSRQSHESCNGCPWSGDPYHGPLRHAIPLRMSAREAAVLAARLSAAVATVLLSVVVVHLDVPADIGESTGVAIRIGLVTLATAGALVAWRWPVAAAGLFAVASIAAGWFAAVAVTPAASLALSAALLIPAVLLWLTREGARRREAPAVRHENEVRRDG
jgi:hypothetical protein